MDFAGHEDSKLRTWKMGGFKGSMQMGQWSLALAILTMISTPAAAPSTATSASAPVSSSSFRISSSVMAMGDSTRNFLLRLCCWVVFPIGDRVRLASQQEERKLKKMLATQTMVGKSKDGKFGSVHTYTVEREQ